MFAPGYDPDRLKALAVSETGFVFDPRTGHSYTVNATGLAMLAAMKDGLPIDEIATRLRDEFDVVSEGVEEDVLTFLDLLAEQGLTLRRARS